jgi:hypothetical protein|nr:MAG TPA: hypothetical protein [Caudoviricetes sp.]
MTLEYIQHKLQEVLNQYSENNNEHFNINESIYREPKDDSKCIGSEPSPSEGILANINILLNKIENEVYFQRSNLRRSSELVYQPIELEQVSPCTSKY